MNKNTYQITFILFLAFIINMSASQVSGYTIFGRITYNDPNFGNGLPVREVGITVQYGDSADDELFVLTDENGEYIVNVDTSYVTLRVLSFNNAALITTEDDSLPTYYGYNYKMPYIVLKERYLTLNVGTNYVGTDTVDYRDVARILEDLRLGREWC
jgi:hypothetical protein